MRKVKEREAEGLIFFPKLMGEDNQFGKREGKGKVKRKGKLEMKRSKILIQSYLTVGAKVVAFILPIKSGLKKWSENV